MMIMTPLAAEIPPPSIPKEEEESSRRSVDHTAPLRTGDGVDCTTHRPDGRGFPESPPSSLWFLSVAPRIRRSPRLSLSPMLLLPPLTTSTNHPNTHNSRHPPRTNKLPPMAHTVENHSTTSSSSSSVSQLPKESPPRAKMDKENFSPVPQQKVLLAVYHRKQIRVKIVFEDHVATKERRHVSVDTETVISPPNRQSVSPLPPHDSSNNTPSHQSTTTSSTSLLKSLLVDTRRDLKEDGTPHEPKERCVYEESDDPYHRNGEGPDGNMGDSLLPSVSNLQPCSPMAAPKNIKIPTTIVLQQLNDRMHHLFPFLQHEREGKNCIVARLFACFSLHMDAKYASSRSPRKRPRDSPNEPSKTLQISIDSILQVLDSLVQLELALLHGEQELRLAHRNRRVAFCAYDGSALQPPSDVIENSHAHKHAELYCLATVMGRLHDLEQQTQQATKAGDLFLQLYEYLTDVFPLSGHALVCAESLSYRSMDFPLRRAFKAAEQYSLDLRQLTVKEWWKTPLTWQRRFADASAQMVRYWLRTELNPVPDRAPSQQYSQQWNLRVCDLVVLQPSDAGAGMGAVLDDGSLSSIVSNAASHISYSFGCDWKSWTSQMALTPDSFSGDSELICKGIAPSSSITNRRRSGILLRQYSTDDWNQATVLLENATSFLAAVNGAQFLYDILAIVVQHPEHEMSWIDTIQYSAVRLRMIPTECLQEQDRHLLLLGYSPRALLEQLPILIQHSKKKAAQEFLEQLAEKCLFGRTDAPSKRRKRAYQSDLDALEFSWEWSTSHIHFPKVTEYVDNEEEESSSRDRI